MILPVEWSNLQLAELLMLRRVQRLRTAELSIPPLTSEVFSNKRIQSYICLKTAGRLHVNLVDSSQ